MTGGLRIALVAPVWLPVPPRAYGGTELLVALLHRHYVEAGHHVVLFATGDSAIQGEVRSVTARGLIDLMADGDAASYEHYESALAAEVTASSSEFDVVHSHLGLAQIPTLSLAACPVVHTQHAPFSADDRWLARRFPTVEIAALSRFQASGLDRPVRIIPSGIDLDRYRPSTRNHGYLAYLGRMGPGKNPIGAIEVAAAAGRELVLAGAPQNRSEKQYFHDEVEPRIDGSRVRYIGPVDHEGKRELLSGAAALLFPIVAGEAFGLVMVEAMACGTPVVATRRASVEEIVDPGLTGFYGPDVGALPPLIDRAARLDREQVRRTAEDRFSFRAMGDRYVALFEELSR